MREIIPTIVPESYEDMCAKASVLSAIASSLHIDAADGAFAPVRTWLPSGEKLPNDESIVYAAHLMVSDPHEKGVDFARAGARRIIGHIEAFQESETVFSAFDAWREAGAHEVGLALLLDTPWETIEPYLTHCDVIHLMTIAHIGKQGIPFDERSLAKIEAMHRRHPDILISVDGGEDAAHIPETARAGAQRFAVGSAITNAEDPARVYKELCENGTNVY